MKTLISTFSFLTFLIFTNCNQPNTAEMLRDRASTSEQKMYVIERNIPNAGHLTAEELQGISQTSCTVLNEMGDDIQWLHSYVTQDKVYCVYTATNKELIEEHAQKGGFPADAIIQVATVIDPSTAK